MPRSWNWLPASSGAGSAKSRAGTGPPKGGQSPSAAAPRPGRTYFSAGAKCCAHLYGRALHTPHRLGRWTARGALLGRKTRSVRSGEGRMRGGESEEGFQQVPAVVARQSPSADRCLWSSLVHSCCPYDSCLSSSLLIEVATKIFAKTIVWLVLIIVIILFFQLITDSCTPCFFYFLLKYFLHYQHWQEFVHRDVGLFFFNGCK